jgi:hypothetical protein
MEAVLSSPVAKIGDAAGVVWHHLADTGPASITALIKDVDLSRDLLMQAIGWLAREDKIEIIEENRKRLITLKA